MFTRTRGRRRLATLGLGSALVAASLSTPLLAATAGADQSSPNTTLATTPTQSNVSITPTNGPLTNLRSGDTVAISVSAPVPGGLFGAEARLCAPGRDITNVAEFQPSGGNCAVAPLVTGTNHYLNRPAENDPVNPNRFVNISFVVGTGGPQTLANDGGTLQCDSTHPCDLWIRQIVPGGNLFQHYSLSFAPLMSVGNVSIVEGDTGKGRALKFPLVLSEPSDKPIEVTWEVRTQGDGFGNATGDPKQLAGVDVQDAGKTKVLKINPSVSTGLTPTLKYLSTTVYGDTTAEPNETYQVHIVSVAYPLGPPTNHAYLVEGDGTGTILNDETAGAPFHFGVGDVSSAEGDTGKNTLSFAVTLSDPQTQAVAVDYTIVGTGVAPNTALCNTKPVVPTHDCKDLGVGITKTLTFTPSGAALLTPVAKAVNVTIYPDGLKESAEQVSVVLSNPRFVVPGPPAPVLFHATGTGTIEAGF